MKRNYTTNETNGYDSSRGATIDQQNQQLLDLRNSGNCIEETCTTNGPVQRQSDHGKVEQSLATRLGFETIARYRLGLIREATVPYDTSTICSQPETAAGFLHRILDSYDREVLGSLFLSSNHRAIGHTLAYIGTLTQAPAEPRGLLVPALLANAASVIIFHNHPSGDPTPSADDISFTRRVAAAGEILGITVLDHLVLGEPPVYSSLRTTHPW